MFLNSASHEAETIKDADSNLRSYRREDQSITQCIAWSPDGNFLASCARNCAAVLIWEISTGKCTALQCTLGAVDGAYTLLRWSPDGKYLFAATAACRFRIWWTPTWCDMVFVNNFLKHSYA